MRVFSLSPILFLFVLLSSCDGNRLGKPYVPPVSSGDCMDMNPTVGTVCPGGGIYLGQDPTAGGGIGAPTYMISPPGCEDSATPRCRDLEDLVLKSWNDGLGQWYDIPGVENVNLAATRSADDGDVNSNAIMGISSPAQGGLHQAARWCLNLSVGGYTDWYLPSKSELTFVYCRSQVTDHDTSMPQESPNCASYGGHQSALRGFAGYYYWSSTEYDGESAWAINFRYGSQNFSPKDHRFMIRCIRKM